MVGVTVSGIHHRVGPFILVHNYNTRSSTRGDIKLANPSNNQLMRTFKYNDVKLWNALAISLRGKPSLNSFKCAYLKDFYTLR